MIQMPTTSASTVSVGPFYSPHTIRVQTPRITSGALGEHFHAVTLLADGDKDVKHGGRVSLQEADNALRKIMNAQSEGANCPKMRDVLEMDPMMLSMMMTQLVLKVSGNNANFLCQQLERDTEVQTELRNKQVAEYQEQINKAIEQADQVRKAGIFNALFDWIISGIEAVAGVLKMVKGFFTADPLAIADGAAYFSAGIAGMVKAGAETAELLGADKSACDKIINVAGKVQTSCEYVALALDIMQIFRGIINATRASARAIGKILSSEPGKALIEALAKGAESELKPLLEKIGKQFSEDIAKLLETAIKDGGKELLNKSEDIVKKKLRDAVLNKMRSKIVKTVISECTNKTLLTTRVLSGAAKNLSASIVALKSAKIQREIERLIAQQGYINFVLDWIEDRKKTQQEYLKEAYQNGANALRMASEIIDNSGTALANIAWRRA